MHVGLVLVNLSLCVFRGGGLFLGSWFCTGIIARLSGLLCFALLVGAYDNGAGSTRSFYSLCGMGCPGWLARGRVGGIRRII